VRRTDRRNRNFKVSRRSPANIQLRTTSCGGTNIISRCREIQIHRVVREAKAHATMPCRAEVILVLFPDTKAYFFTRSHRQILNHKISFQAVFVTPKQDYVGPTPWTANQKIKPHVLGLLQGILVTTNQCLQPLVSHQQRVGGR
jgi:hypothetical protein